MYVLAIRIPPGNRSRDQIPCKRIISRMFDIVRMWKLLAGKMTTFEKISALVTISYIHRIVNHTSSVLIVLSFFKSRKDSALQVLISPRTFTRYRSVPSNISLTMFSILPQWVLPPPIDLSFRYFQNSYPLPNFESIFHNSSSLASRIITMLHLSQPAERNTLFSLVPYTRHK